MSDYWLRQIDQPLFPDAEWAKPERSAHAGKLLIIGGNQLEFSVVQSCYEQALSQGIGACNVVLPQSARRVIGSHPDIEFATSTSKGSFALESETELRGFLSWADTCLLPGELGRNNETTQLLEHLLDATNKQLVITRDAFDLLLPAARKLAERPKTTLVISIAQLQDLTQALHWPHAIRFQMTLPELTEQLHLLTSKFPIAIVVYFETNLISAYGGEVVSTKHVSEPEHWRAALATRSSIWQTWLQNKALAALSTAVFQIRDKS